jgi:hypothetical protein
MSAAVVEVAGLLEPVMWGPLGFIGERDPDLAGRLEQAVKEVQECLADALVPGATEAVRGLLRWLQLAWARGLMDPEDFEGLVELAGCLLGELGSGSEGRG